MAEVARKSEWDVVLLSEVKAEEEGVVWLGQDEERVGVVHSRRAGVLLRGEALRWWCAEGMRKKVEERVVSVKVKEWVLTAVYMPVQVRGNEAEVDEVYEAVARHVEWKKGGEINVVGGDFNAHVGGGEGSRGLCG